MNTNRRHPLHPTLRLTALLCIASLLSGMTEAYASLPDGENNLRPGTALSTHKSGWVCAVVLDEQVPVPGQEYEGYFLYGNQGRQAIDIPYVHLDAREKTSLRFTKADGWSDQLELMAVSGDGAASRLEPGETQRIPFFYKTEGDAVSVKMGYTLDDPSEFDWDAAGALMRPAGADEEVWNIFLAILKGNVGATWNDYLARMRADCDQLAEVGQRTGRLDLMWQMEIAEALGVDRVVGALAANTDLARAARGGGLTLAREYRTGLQPRFQKGLFGYGWSCSYDNQVELRDGGGVLALHVEGMDIPLFEKKGGRWEAEGGDGETTLEETADEYVLKNRNGSAQRISKVHMRISGLEDNLGNVLTFTYNDDGSLAKIAHGDGPWLEFEYEGGLISAARDDQGRTVQYEYSGELLTKATGADGLETRYRYLPADGSATSRALRQIAYADGTTQDFTYDGEGRVATMAVNGTEYLTEIVRGACGSYKVAMPNGGMAEVKAGASGEILEAVNPLGQRMRREYNAEGRLSAVTGPTGKRASLAYGADGQVVRATDAAGAETMYSYAEGTGLLESLADARGNAVRFGYDALGRGESVGYADGSVERIEYNERGDVVRSVNRRGQGISYAYDKEGRLVSKKWDDGRTFTLAYDEKGNCTRAWDSVTGAVSMEYDAAGRPVRIVDGKGRGFAYRYDAMGRVVARRTLLGSGATAEAVDVQRYEYDALGRVAKLTDGAGKLWVENKYDGTTAAPVRQRYGNGTEAATESDLMGRTTRMAHYAKDGREMAFFAYEYDAEGRRTSQTTKEGVERYTYDTVGQLTDVVYPDGSEEHFTYDAVGNRIGSTGILPAGTTQAGSLRSQMAYTANDLNQYTRAGDATFAYDADGNLVGKTTPGGGTTRYFYDVENRLVAVTNEAQDIAWSCEYDVFGNRTRVVDHGVTKDVLWEMNGGLPTAVAEFGADGAVAARHVALGSVKVADVGEGTRYFHVDGLASARLVTDEAGRAVGQASYRAFGGVRRSDGAAACDGWVGALGVERDAATGLVFMRNRYYDTETGRFIQMDPIRLAAGDVNLYRYCANGAVDGVDPMGTLGEDCNFFKIRPTTYNTVSKGKRRIVEELARRLGKQVSEKRKEWACLVRIWSGEKCIWQNGECQCNGSRGNQTNSEEDDQQTGKKLNVVGYVAAELLIATTPLSFLYAAQNAMNTLSNVVATVGQWIQEHPVISAIVGVVGIGVAIYFAWPYIAGTALGTWITTVALPWIAGVAGGIWTWVRMMRPPIQVFGY